VTKDFRADGAVLADFRAYLEARKLRFTEEDLQGNREAIQQLVQEGVVGQVFGEGAARRRSLAWDPQVRKALELVPKAEQLRRDPRAFVGQGERERRLADGASG